MLDKLITESYKYFMEAEENKAKTTQDRLSEEYLKAKKAANDKFGYNHPVLAGGVSGGIIGGIDGAIVGGLGGAALGAASAGLGSLGIDTGLDTDLNIHDAAMTGAEYGAGVGALGVGIPLGIIGGNAIERRKAEIGYPKTI